MKEGWKYIDFKDVFPISMGKTPPRGDKSCWDVNKETQNRWVSIADISANEGKYIYDTKEYVSDKGAANIRKVAKGSLLMSFKLSIGRMSFAGEELYTNEAIIAIPATDKYDLRFVYYYLLSYDWKSLTQGNEKVKGATLNKTSIGKIQLPIVTLSEQQEIVTYLDTAFEKIDRLKENAEKSLSDAKALFQSALRRSLTPALSQGEGECKWEEKTLKALGQTQTGTTPSKTDKANYGDYMEFIRPSEIDYDGIGGIDYNCEMKLSEQGALNGRIFKSNSVFMVCIGATIGKVGYSTKEVSCNQQINVFTPTDEMDFKFAYYAMKDPSFQHRVIKEGTSSQATLPIINKGKWEQLTISYPDKSTQHSIVTTLDALSEKVSALEANCTKTIAECNALKQALLKQVFE